MFELFLGRFFFRVLWSFFFGEFFQLLFCRCVFMKFRRVLVCSESWLVLYWRKFSGSRFCCFFCLSSFWVTKVQFIGISRFFRVVVQVVIYLIVGCFGFRAGVDIYLSFIQIRERSLIFICACVVLWVILTDCIVWEGIVVIQVFSVVKLGGLFYLLFVYSVEQFFRG